MKRAFRSLTAVLLVLLLSVPALAEAAPAALVRLATYGDGSGAVAVSCAHRVYVDSAYNFDTNREISRLYDFEGNLLLTAKNITLSPNWIFVSQQDNLVGVWSYDLKNVVPCQYNTISLVDDDTVILLDQGVYHDRFGNWIGTCHRMNLRTGETTEEKLRHSDAARVDSSGKTVYPINWENVTPLTGRTYPTWQGPDGLVVTEGSDQQGDFRAIFNKSGQLILRAHGDGYSIDVSYGWNGRYLLLRYDDGKGSVFSRLYTGRGRFLTQIDGTAFVFVLADGEYYLVQSDSAPYCRLYNLEGAEVPLPEGVRQIGFDGSLPPYGSSRIDDDHCLDVEEVGLYALPRFAPSPSAWAADDAAAAVKAGLVDSDVAWWWRDNCTREDFCRMVMRGIEKSTGKTGEALVSDALPAAFTDCDTDAVREAAQLGIVKGVGSGKFAPARFLTRQEAAVMLARAAAYLGLRANGAPLAFSDAGDTAPWAADAVAAVSAMDCGASRTPLMQGQPDGRFAPLGSYTVEQAAITVLRLTNYE